MNRNRRAASAGDRRASTAVLSIGSNLGGRLDNLRGAVAGLADVLVVASAVYETEPWGNTEQERFLNAVLIVSGALDQEGWLARAQALEAAAGRERTVHWGPRTLDVDVITVDDVRQNDAHLTLPHPRAHERAFVLVPLVELRPALELPGMGRADELLAALPDAEVDGVRRHEESLVA